MKLKNFKSVRYLGITAITGTIVINLTDFAGIVLKHHYNPVTTSISDLAIGTNGWIQDIGFYVGGVGVISCAIGLHFVLNGKWEVKLGEFFLVMAGTGVLFAGIFHTHIPGQSHTIVGEIHGISSLTAMITWLPVSLLISPAIRDRKNLFIYAIATGILAILLEVGRGRLPSDWMFFGLHERLIGENAVIWTAVMSWTLLIRHNQSRREIV